MRSQLLSRQAGSYWGSLALGMRVVTAGQWVALCQSGAAQPFTNIHRVPTMCQAPCWVSGCICEREKNPVQAKLIS